jgi:hypothetical protein
VNAGAIYDSTAGQEAVVTVQLRDAFGNDLQSGGDRLELALLGVGGKVYCTVTSALCGITLLSNMYVVKYN